MSVVFPVAFDIYMWILLNEFTIHFMDCKVRLCGLEKLSQQKNKVEYSHFTGMQTTKKKTQNSNETISAAGSDSIGQIFY